MYYTHFILFLLFCSSIFNLDVLIYSLIFYSPKQIVFFLISHTEAPFLFWDWMNIYLHHLLVIFI